MRLFFYILIFINLPLVSQNYIDYYNLANEAEFSFEEGKYTDAKNILITLENKFLSLKPKDYFYLGAIYYMDGDSINGKNYFLKCAKNFGTPSWDIERLIKKKPEIKISQSAILDFKFIEEQNINLKNKSVEDTINYFFQQDLSIRSQEPLDINKDYILQKSYLAYLKKNGIPNTSLYGDMFALLFMHVYNDKLYEEYNKFLFEELKKGSICPYYYCSFVDRRLYDKEKSTLYNSYGKVCKKEDCMVQIIQNRKKVGLSIYYNGPCYSPILYEEGMIIKTLDQ